MKKRVEKALQSLKQTIQSREDIFKNRSETWKESLKGERYNLQTEVLRTIAEEQEEILISLDSWEEEN